MKYVKCKMKDNQTIFFETILHGFRVMRCCMRTTSRKWCNQMPTHLQKNHTRRHPTLLATYNSVYQPDKIKTSNQNETADEILISFVVLFWCFLEILLTTIKFGSKKFWSLFSVRTFVSASAVLVSTSFESPKSVSSTSSSAAPSRRCNKIFSVFMSLCMILCLRRHFIPSQISLDNLVTSGGVHFSLTFFFCLMRWRRVPLLAYERTK